VEDLGLPAETVFYSFNTPDKTKIEEAYSIKHIQKREEGPKENTAKEQRASSSILSK